MSKWTALAVCVVAVAAAGTGIFAIWAFEIRDEAPSESELYRQQQLAAAQERSQIEAADRREAVEITRWFERLLCEWTDLALDADRKECKHPKIERVREVSDGLWIIQQKDLLGDDRCYLVEAERFRPVSVHSLREDLGIYDQLTGIELVTC